jgi:hypothetical protein
MQSASSSVNNAPAPNTPNCNNGSAVKPGTDGSVQRTAVIPVISGLVIDAANALVANDPKTSNSNAVAVCTHRFVCRAAVVSSGFHAVNASHTLLSIPSTGAAHAIDAVFGTERALVTVIAVMLAKGTAAAPSATDGAKGTLVAIMAVDSAEGALVAVITIECTCRTVAAVITSGVAFGAGAGGAGGCRTNTLRPNGPNNSNCSTGAVCTNRFVKRAPIISTVSTFVINAGHTPSSLPRTGAVITPTAVVGTKWTVVAVVAVASAAWAVDGGIISRHALAASDPETSYRSAVAIRTDGFFRRATIIGVVTVILAGHTLQRNFVPGTGAVVTLSTVMGAKWTILAVSAVMSANEAKGALVAEPFAKGACAAIPT